MLTFVKEKNAFLGSNLIEFGKVPDSFYIVRRGKVEISTKIKKGTFEDKPEIVKLRTKTGITAPEKEVGLVILGEGTMFGHKESIGLRKANYRSKVITETVSLYEISSYDVIKILKYSDEQRLYFIKHHDNLGTFISRRMRFNKRSHRKISEEMKVNELLNIRSKQWVTDDLMHKLKSSKISKFVHALGNSKSHKSIKNKQRVLKDLQGGKNLKLEVIDRPLFAKDEDVKRYRRVFLSQKYGLQKNTVKTTSVDTGVKFCNHDRLYNSVIRHASSMLMKTQNNTLNNSESTKSITDKPRKRMIISSGSKSRKALGKILDCAADTEPTPMFEISRIKDPQALRNQSRISSFCRPKVQGDVRPRTAYFLPRSSLQFESVLTKVDSKIYPRKRKGSSLIK